MTKLSDYLTTTGRKKADLAKAIGVSRGYVTELCNGTKRPGLSVAVSIEAATGGHVPAKAWADVPSEMVTLNTPERAPDESACQPEQSMNVRGEA